MAAPSSDGSFGVSRNHRYLLVAAAGMTYLLITMGGVVCVTQSGGGCPDWPGCYGQVVPPAQTESIIEYLHRFIAGLTSPLIILAAIVGWRRTRSAPLVSAPPIIAIIFLIAVIIFGAMAVLQGIPPIVAALDLGSALIVLALLVTATVAAFTGAAGSSGPAPQLSFRSAFSKLTLWTVGAVFLVLVSSVLVATSPSQARCLGWPLYNETVTFSGLQDWLLVTRRLIAGVAVLLVLFTLLQAWRTRHAHPAINRAAAATGILLLVEIVTGILLLAGGAPIIVRILYAAAAAALWSAVVALAVAAGLAPTLSDRESIPIIQTTGSAI